MNPADAEGNVTRCRICDSKFHWQHDCPASFENQRKAAGGTQHITLFQSQHHKTDEMRTFVGETFNCAVLDSGCSQTVCGVNWLDCYKERLQSDAAIREQPYHTVFKFGSGEPVTSMKKVTLPIMIGDQPIDLETDVVETDIPLLLSKSAMKKSSTILDFNQDTANMFGQRQPLVKTTSGHYAIPIIKERSIAEGSKENVQQCLAMIASTIPSKDEILKLHCQFGHCDKSKLTKLVVSSKLWTDTKGVHQLISDVSEHCATCQRYKKRKPRPVVGLPMATDFNQAVAMDLTTYQQGTWMLHLILILTEFCCLCTSFQEARCHFRCHNENTD